jgi:hypothetical protein
MADVVVPVVAAHPPACEAAQVPLEPDHDVLTAIMDWVCSHNVSAHWMATSHTGHHVVVAGADTARPGEWILRTENGKFIVLDDDRFQRGYTKWPAVARADNTDRKD